MSQMQRLGIVVATLVVAVAAFLILKPGDDSPPSQATSTIPAAVAETPDLSTPEDERVTETAPKPAPRPAPKPRPRAVEIVARGLQPVGGVKEIKLRKGETIRLLVRSDQDDEAHLHGYDVSREVGPGTVARFAVPATIEGIFELELEHAGAPIAEITVEP